MVSATAVTILQQFRITKSPNLQFAHIKNRQLQKLLLLNQSPVQERADLESLLITKVAKKQIKQRRTRAVWKGNEVNLREKCCSIRSSSNDTAEDKSKQNLTNSRHIEHKCLPNTFLISFDSANPTTERSSPRQKTLNSTARRTFKTVQATERQCPRLDKTP